METSKFFEGVSSSQLELIDGLLSRAILEENADNEPMQIREIVPIEKWVNYKYFLGSWSKDVYPYWKDRIIEYINSGVPELVITGSIGSGKSSYALLCMLRKLYELSCYKYPQRLFKLSDLTDIYFAYLSLNYKHAERTGFGQMKTMVDNIAYFQKEFPRDQNISSVLKFPERITIMPGTDNLSVISTNLFGCVMDEADFYRKGSSSQGGDIERANNIYREVTDRRVSRFMIGGYDPGFSALVSSSSYSSSFVAQRVRAGLKEGVCAYVTKLWDVKPESYSKNRFAIFKGTDLQDAMVMDTVEDLKALTPVSLHPLIARTVFNSEEVGYKLVLSALHALPTLFQRNFVEVPTDFRKNFDTDIYQALRNIAGEAVAPSGKLFTSKVIWTQNINPVLVHPFTKDSISVSIKTHHTVNDFFVASTLFEVKDGKVGALLRHPNARRYLHIDQSTSHDATGLAMVHISEFVKDPNTLLSVPKVEVDFVLQIIAPKAPDKISIAKVRNFVFWLKSVGVKIGKVTYDQFQSSDSIQIMQVNGIPADLLSVDRDDKQYLQAVDLLNESRLDMYHYEALEAEFFNLDHDLIKRKVDHPEKLETGEKGSKDIADGLVGAIHNCLSDVNNQVTLSSSDILSSLRTPSREKKHAVVPMEKGMGNILTHDKTYTLPKKYKGKGIITGMIGDDSGVY